MLRSQCSIQRVKAVQSKNQSLFVLLLFLALFLKEIPNQPIEMNDERDFSLIAEIRNDHDIRLI